MKNFIGLLFVVTLFTFVSCGGDDDCTADSFVGTYTGTVDCDGTSESGTIMLTKISDTEVELTDTDGTALTLTISGCTASGSENLLGLADVSVDVTLDGDKLIYSQDVSTLGLNVSCSGTLDKQ